MINEGLNDKGIFKALFVIGIPYSGKSYTISQINNMAKVVNTDKTFEFISKDLDWISDGSRTKLLTKNKLYGYLKESLPLIVDGTSMNIHNILYRMGLLESLGYDVGVVWVESDLEYAMMNKERYQRKRTVPDDFVKKVYEVESKHVNYIKNKCEHFYHIKSRELNNETLVNLYKKTQGFFNSDVENPIGSSFIDDKTISLDNDIIKNKVNYWYMK